jgi:hypothetical protein
MEAAKMHIENIEWRRGRQIGEGREMCVEAEGASGMTHGKGDPIILASAPGSN